MAGSAGRRGVYRTGARRRAHQFEAAGGHLESAGRFIVRLRPAFCAARLRAHSRAAHRPDMGIRPGETTMKLIVAMALSAAATASATWASGAGSTGLELVATIAMPSVKGRIDHFSADARGRRLYVAALGNDTVEVLDTRQNRHEKSVRGFGEPQGVLHLPEPSRLYVANGSADRLDI